MRFSCPFCNYAVTADDSARGYRVNCSSCGKSILVPTGRFEEGCIVGDFIIRSKLGEGSIGAVYKATQISLDRQVALKILSPEYTTAKGASSFLKEARAAAKLIHANLVQSYAVGEDNGTCYMAMTYVNGETLKARLKREGKIPVDEALHIVQQVAEALYYAWDEIRIIHRDVKPDNIMITEDGIVKLTDLGLAMNQSEWTEDMEISGSPSYMSPEQFAGEKLDTRSDIYSLGITLYQMISGVLPFNADTIKSVAKQHFESEAIPLNKLDPSVPPKVTMLVKKMIAKLPEDRFEDMEALLNEIWTIRQKTAPNKSLVPDVHTISIKRLDYDIQNEAITANKNAQKLERKIQSHYDMVRIFMILVPVLLVCGVMFAFIFGRKNQENETELLAKVETFERFTEDKSIPFDIRYAEGTSILDAYATPENTMQKYLLARVSLRLSEIQYTELQNQKNIFEKEKLQLNAEISKLNSLYETTKNELQNIPVTSTATASADTEKLRNDLTELKKANESLKKELITLNLNRNEISKNYELQKEQLIKSWKKELRSRIQTLRKNFKFSDIDVLLTIEKVRNPFQKAWLEGCEVDNALYSKVFSALNDSGTKYASVPVFTDSKIVMISNGYIDYLDSKGRIRQKHWSEIPVNNLWDILSKDPKGFGSEAEVKSAIELFKGNFGMAVKNNPAAQELRDLAQDIYDENYFFIRCAVPVDRKRAEQMTQNLLKQMEGIENYDFLKSDLKQLFKRDNGE